MINERRLRAGKAIVVEVTLEREDEIVGPVIAPFFPQVSFFLSVYFCCRILKKSALFFIFEWIKTSIS